MACRLLGAALIVSASPDPDTMPAAREVAGAAAGTCKPTYGYWTTWNSIR
jgi:hypothetical protein